MTKQEEVREGMAKMLYAYKCQGLVGSDRLVDWSGLTEQQKGFYRQDADHFLISMKQKGVVIKVDRGLPGFMDKIISNKSADYIAGLRDAIERLQEAGFTAVKPLIEIMKR